MQPESRVRRFTCFLLVWLSHTGSAQPVAFRHGCRASGAVAACVLRRASSLRASLPWGLGTAAGLVGTGRPSLRPEPVSSCSAATAVPASPLADSKWVQLPAGSSSSANDADGNSSLHIPCTPHAWAFPNTTSPPATASIPPSTNGKHPNARPHERTQEPQPNLRGPTCPRISLHRACLSRCQLCSPSLARVAGRERERERLPRSPPKERAKARTSGMQNMQIILGTTRATSMAAGTEFNAMVGECHPYLQLFSSLVRHGGMTKSSACRRETRSETTPTTSGTTRATSTAAGTEFTCDGWRVSPVPAAVQQAGRAWRHD